METEKNKIWSVNYSNSLQYYALLIHATYEVQVFLYDCIFDRLGWSHFKEFNFKLLVQRLWSGCYFADRSIDEYIVLELHLRPPCIITAQSNRRNVVLFVAAYVSKRTVVSFSFLILPFSGFVWLRVGEGVVLTHNARLCGSIDRGKLVVRLALITSRCGMWSGSRGPSPSSADEAGITGHVISITHNAPGGFVGFSHR